MSSVNHQTIKLTRGKHKAPDDGACVMELASMLADEPFSDHPISVCPVIGAFLRAYNDSLDDGRRQDLYAYASKVVGSRASEAVQRARLERFLAWGNEQREHRLAQRRRPAWLRALLDIPKPSVSATLNEVARCARPTDEKHADESHARVLALVDDVLFIGTPEWGATQSGEGSAALPATAASL